MNPAAHLLMGQLERAELSLNTRPLEQRLADPGQLLSPAPTDTTAQHMSEAMQGFVN
jgi:hypothetical protein